MNLFRHFTSRLALLALTGLILLATGCDLLPEKDDEKVFTAGAYVTNQGNFSQGNGSVTLFDPSTRDVRTLSSTANLGSVLQSNEVYGTRMYTMASTANRVVAIDPDTDKPVTQLSVPNPRYMGMLNPGKAYVTSQLGYYGRPSLVTAFDPVTGAKLDSVEVEGNADGLAIVGNHVFVATGAYAVNHNVVVINTDDDTVVKTVDVGCDAPRYLTSDTEGDVFVICEGNTVYDDQGSVTGKTDGAIVVLDGQEGTVTKTIPFAGQLGTGGVGQDAFSSPDTHEIYVIAEGNKVLRIDTKTNSVVAELGPFTGGMLGAVGYDALNNQLYVAHIMGYDQAGNVTIHDREGKLVHEFAAGVAPVYISFRRAILQ